MILYIYILHLILVKPAGTRRDSHDLSKYRSSSHFVAGRGWPFRSHICGWLHKISSKSSKFWWIYWLINTTASVLVGQTHKINHKISPLSFDFLLFSIPTNKLNYRVQALNFLNPIRIIIQWNLLKFHQNPLEFPIPIQWNLLKSPQNSIRIPWNHLRIP